MKINLCNDDIKWEVLIKRAIENNQEAITEIYNKTYKQGFALARQMVRDEQEAMDIMQEAYISAFGHLDTVREPEKFRNWFNCIVANKCRDYFRKHKDIVFSDLETEEVGAYEDTLESDIEEFHPDKATDYSETKRLMNEILQKLSDDQRLCILMYYYQELSVKEIAASLQCSENTVKTRLGYARKKIETEVKALERKGTKLYSVSVLPFILWMLRDGEEEIMIPKMTEMFFLKQKFSESTHKIVPNTVSKAVTFVKNNLAIVAITTALFSVIGIAIII